MIKEEPCTKVLAGSKETMRHSMAPWGQHQLRAWQGPGIAIPGISASDCGPKSRCVGKRRAEDDVILHLSPFSVTNSVSSEAG